jgi:uncharacterized repeat protein (TIGR01451 family)
MTVVNNVRAAGILTVHAAGNYGSTCYTIITPAAIYDASFTVGATDNNDNIVSFSSRGPVSIDGSNRLKPDISAPGLNIFSTVPGGGFRYASGTSMAAPHVAGVAALLLSRRPDLRGKVDQIEDLIRLGAVPRTTSQTCGVVPGSQVPNNTYGWGRVDALGSVSQSLLAIQKEPSWYLYDPGDLITYTLQITNLHTLEPIHNVRITDTLPLNTIFINASQPFTRINDQIVWEFPQLDAGQSQSMELVRLHSTLSINCQPGYIASSDEISLLRVHRSGYTWRTTYSSLFSPSQLDQRVDRRLPLRISVVAGGTSLPKCPDLAGIELQQPGWVVKIPAQPRISQVRCTRW